MGKGSICFGKGEDKTTIWSFCNSRQFPVSRYSILNWWYLYMFTVLYFAYVLMVSLGLVTDFSILLMFVIISLKNCTNILCMIVDLCWFRFADVCRVVKNDDWHQKICDICVYCMILLIYEFLLNNFKIINTVVPLSGSISG